MWHDSLLNYLGRKIKREELTKALKLEPVTLLSMLQRWHSICISDHFFGVWVQICQPVIELGRILQSQAAARNPADI